MRRGVKRTWTSTRQERIEDTKPAIFPLAKSFWPLSSDERRGIELLFATEEAGRLATFSLHCRKDHATHRGARCCLLLGQRVQLAWPLYALLS